MNLDKEVEKKVKVVSFADNTISYDVDLANQSCTCNDWILERSNYPKDDPRRLCKHIINQLDIDNLSSELRYFRDSLQYYQENKRAFRKDFENVIYVSDADCKVLYVKDDWINIFDRNGKKYGFIPYGYSGGFTDFKFC